MEKEKVIIGNEPNTIQDINQVNEDLFTKLRKQNQLLRKPTENDALFLFRPNRDPVPVSKQDFHGILHNLINFVYLSNAQNAPGERTVVLDRKFTDIFFHSEQKFLLAPFETVIKEPAITLYNGKPELTRPGYDASTQIYFLESPFSRIQPLNTTDRLKYCFSGVPFASEKFKANVIASLLGAIVLDRSFENPLVAVTGNQPGIGKTKLTASMGYILTGAEPAPVSYQQEEMNKQIGARFHDNQRFILIDNVSTPNDQAFRSDPLAIHITSGHSKTVRELGVSRKISMQGVLFALTANHCRLHEDLAVRSLMIRLYREQLGAMEPFVFDQAVEFRSELYGELLGLALREVESYPTNYKQFFRFRRWLSFVAPRIEPVFGPLAIDESLELDPRLVGLCEWAISDPRTNTGAAFSCGEFIEWAEATADLTLRELISSLHGNKAAGKAKSLSTLLQNLTNRTVTLDEGVRVTLELSDPGYPGRAKRFRFNIVRSEAVAA